MSFLEKTLNAMREAKKHIQEVLVAPDPLLRRRAQEVDLAAHPIEQLQQWQLHLEHTLLHRGFKALAANQIKIPYRMITVQLNHASDPLKLLTLINPTVEHASLQLTTTIHPELPEYREGCGSLPGLYAVVPRAVWVETAGYIIEKGQLKRVVKKLVGLDGRAAFHEIDHLNGIYITDQALRAGSPIFAQKSSGEQPKELSLEEREKLRVQF